MLSFLLLFSNLHVHKLFGKIFIYYFNNNSAVNWNALKTELTKCFPYQHCFSPFVILKNFFVSFFLLRPLFIYTCVLIGSSSNSNSHMIFQCHSLY